MVIPVYQIIFRDTFLYSVGHAKFWFLAITCLQVAFDLPMATDVPMGYGHNYLQASHIDAWATVIEPAHWTDEDTQHLKEKFADQPDP